MKKLATLLASLILASFAICAPSVCVRPAVAPAAERLDVDDHGDTIYDEFDSVDDAPVNDVVTPAKGDRILVVGDSEACAVGAYAEDATWRAKAGLGVPEDVVRVRCKVSTTVEYWGAQGRMREAVDDFEPTVVIIFLGTNHYGAKEVPDVEPILGLIKERSVRCLWVGNTAVRGKRWAINGLLRDAVVPTCSYFDTEAANVQLADGVHPGPTAAQRWLKDAWQMIPVDGEDGGCTW